MGGKYVAIGGRGGIFWQELHKKKFRFENNDKGMKRLMKRSIENKEKKEE